MSAERRIAVAMSGGVDSSVAAALLVESGDEVFGLMMRLWSDGPDRTNRCCSPQDMALARRVAAQLEIPFHVIDARVPFKRLVVDFFVDGYAQGVTPNPCLECNRSIRWELLLEKALAMGATHLATGHYARLQDQGGSFSLLRATDRKKDQSYVLSVLGQDQLSHALFPLGDLTKQEVRAEARRLNLPVAERRDSQDLCFIGEKGYGALLRQELASQPSPGPILNQAGVQLGEHQGLPFYTIGQRKGLGISAPQALYVLEKDLERNALILGTRASLGKQRFVVERVNWLSGRSPEVPISLDCQVRYQAKEVPAMVSPLNGRQVKVELETPTEIITPGQAAVFYKGQECIGGGIISR